MADPIFVPVPDCAKVALLWTQYGQHLVNTLWFRKSGGWTTTGLTELATAINSWVMTNLLPGMNGNVTYNGCSAVDMSAPGQEGVIVPETSGNTGSGGGAPLPSNVTAAVSFRTGLTGRSNRGRNYIVGLSGDEITGDSLTAGTVANWTSIFNVLGTYLVDLGAQHVVASLFHGVDVDHKPIPRIEGIAHDVTNYIVDAALDSMRRRLIGRGN